MTTVRLGAVGYLNVRPLVFGLDRSPRFSLRYDLPSECARLLHGGSIDVGMIPSIEYQLPPGDEGYRIVPDLAIASRGQVASVALYTRGSMSDVRSIAMDAGSRTSVALVRVLCDRLFHIQPAIESHRADLPAMLERCDAALIIGDNALLIDHDAIGVQKIDLGEAWTSLTGLPFVWAVWAGRPGVLTPDHVSELRDARDLGVKQPEAIAKAYFNGAPERYALGTRYLRDNIKYYLGEAEREALRSFHQYAAEIGIIPRARDLQFY